MKKSIIAILTCILILLSVGLSYAYFTGMIFGEKKNISVVSKQLRIVFTDNQELGSSEIKPGWNESKTFSVKNESDDTFNYNIVFKGLVNTFVTEGFLQYKITSSNGYNMTDYLDIPKSSTPQDVTLAYDIDIPVDTTQEYTIEFIYNDSETVDQSDDMGKLLEGTLAIVEGTVNPNIKYTVTMNSDNGTITPTSNQAIKYENLEFEVTPDTGYDINSMSVSCTPVANTVITDNKIKVNDIRQDHDCTVSFDKETYTVNIVVNNGESDALNKKVEYGGSGAAKITPDKGYTLSGATVEGAGCSLNDETGELLISNVVSNGTCTVNLPRDKYQVILTGTGIQESDSPQEAEYEGSTTIEFTLSAGYELGSNVINCDNGEPSISGNTLTVSNVQDNTTCTLSPTLKSYDVTLVVNGGTPTNETKTIEHNGSNTYTITNETGYKLELDGNITCTGNATGSLSGSTVTISGVTTTQTCTVNLKKETYTISVSSNNEKYVTVSPANSTVEHGDDLEINITPKGGAKYKSNDCGGTINENKVIISNITESKSCTITFEYESKILSDKIKDAYIPVAGRTDFSVIDNGTPALYTGTDDQGTTYYFSGDGSSMNNWVKFADKWWRIIRINGNGSVRLLYAGDGNDATDIGSSAFNSTRTDPMYVGWKYGDSGTLTSNRTNKNKSTIYGVVENWYNGLDSTYKNYIDTGAIYCNDRELENGSTYSTSVTFHYVAYTRLADNKTPIFTCSNTSDRFNTFGLMTADEVAYAGGSFDNSSPKAYYYLAKNGSSSIIGSRWWWLMTPSFWDNLGNQAYLFSMSGSGSYYGQFASTIANNSRVVRPVVSLKSCVTVNYGDGSSDYPYELSISNTCSGYNVTANITNGYVSTSPNVKSVASGETVEFLIEPNEGYTLSGATVSGTGCTFDATTGILKASNVTSTRTCSVTLNEDKTLASVIKKAYPPKAERTDFSVIDNGTPSLYTGEDDQGITYYFSGDGSSMNNWVSFAGSLWRIIRINGNESVRLLYAGDGNVGSASNKYNGVGSLAGKSTFNNGKNNPMFVGWKYGTTGSLDNNRTNENKSTIYGVVESWYTGLDSAYKNYVDTSAIYCNDRELASESEYSTSVGFHYAVRERIITNKAPIFTCSNSSDIYTGGGNGNNNSLPVGLMVADEVAFAGGVYGTNSPKAYYYLAKDGTSSITGSSYWWTMSPSLFERYSSTNSNAYVFYVRGSAYPGHLSSDYVNDSYVVRPVVSLKSNTLVSGSGSADDPYVVEGLG